MLRSRLIVLTLSIFLLAASAQEAARYDYRVVATNNTSTAEKEMNQAAQEGFSFASVMGGETGFGGNEAVVIMMKSAISAPEPQKRTYRLLATSRTSTMQKEMQQLADEGFDYKGQTVFSSTFGGKEVVVIMERVPSQAAARREFRLLATTRTSTMEKELKDAGDAGFQLVGMTVAKTALGGTELVSIMRKEMK
jgi:hypothetical protein